MCLHRCSDFMGQLNRHKPMLVLTVGSSHATSLPIVRVWCCEDGQSLLRIQRHYDVLTRGNATMPNVSEYFAVVTRLSDGTIQREICHSLDCAKIRFKIACSNRNATECNVIQMKVIQGFKAVS